jgi:hypothetical protein
MKTSRLFIRVPHFRFSLLNEYGIDTLDKKKLGQFNTDTRVYVPVNYNYYGFSKTVHSTELKKKTHTHTYKVQVLLAYKHLS